MQTMTQVSVTATPKCYLKDPAVPRAFCNADLPPVAQGERPSGSCRSTQSPLSFSLSYMTSAHLPAYFFNSTRLTPNITFLLTMTTPTEFSTQGILQHLIVPVPVNHPTLQTEYNSVPFPKKTKNAFHRETKRRHPPKHTSLA